LKNANIQGDFYMTRQYTDMNQHDALYNAAREYPGGIEALAQRMDMSANVLRSKLAPGVKTHHITFEEASRIVEFLQEAKVDCATLPLLAMNWRHNLIAFPMPAADHLSDEQLAQAVFKVMTESGDVARVLNESLADGKLTLAEMDNIEREFQEAMAAFAELRERARQRFAAQSSSLRVA
jgi:hypothetical protein